MICTKRKLSDNPFLIQILGESNITIKTAHTNVTLF